MNKIKLVIGLLASVIISSCALEDASFIENKVYLDRESVGRVVELPVSIHDTYVQSLSARVPLKAEKDIKVKFAVARTMVSEYNSFYGEEAELLPSENYYFDQTTVEIAEGTVFAPENNIVFEGLLDLDPEVVYVLPVTVKSYDTSTLDERAVVYYVFRRTGIVNVVANFDNNGTGVSAKVKWNNLAPVMNDPAGFTYEALMWCTFTGDGLPFDSAAKNYPAGHEDMYIMVLMGAGGTVNATQIRYYLDPRPDTGGHYWFELTNFNRRNWTVEGAHPKAQPKSEQFTYYPDREWFHWAVTFDKASGELKWYCDGNLVSSEVVKDRNFKIVSDDSIEEWWIGHDNTWWWAGKLSEVRIWNRALTAEEINSDYHAYYVDPETANGLACYWKFNEGTGGTIQDYSGNENHATVTSASPIIWEKVDLPAR